MRPLLLIFAMTTIFSVQSPSVLGHFKGTVLDVKGYCQLNLMKTQKPLAQTE